MRPHTERILQRHLPGSILASVQLLHRPDRKTHPGLGRPVQFAIVRRTTIVDPLAMRFCTHRYIPTGSICIWTKKERLRKHSLIDFAICYSESTAGIAGSTRPESRSGRNCSAVEVPIAGLMYAPGAVMTSSKERGVSPERAPGIRKAERSCQRLLPRLGELRCAYQVRSVLRRSPGSF